MDSPIIGRFSLKSVTTDGNICRWMVFVHANGVSDINFIVLSSEDSIPGFEKFYTKMGKSIFVQAIGIKFTSLGVIARKVQDYLVQNGTTEDQIEL